MINKLLSINQSINFGCARPKPTEVLQPRTDLSQLLRDQSTVDDFITAGSGRGAPYGRSCSAAAASPHLGLHCCRVLGGRGLRGSILASGGLTHTHTHIHAAHLYASVAYVCGGRHSAVYLLYAMSDSDAASHASG